MKKVSQKHLLDIKIKEDMPVGNLVFEIMSIDRVFLVLRCHSCQQAF